MLNIGIDVNIDVTQVKYPIYFEGRNCCVHCGSEGTLSFVDKFGNLTRKEIYPFDHIKCTSCGRPFSIKWNPDPKNSSKMIPCAVDPSFKQEFVNLVNLRKIRENGDKNL